ncbi:DUF4260 domain-containing protein [Pedobacter sp. SYP-B3415]|uniref:DUF4260 domain-containing protein n=1 Tax=Pedobacter sp. SYP-B3415 TaxID=2496641 RepID=UPI00101CCA97|nr:DUF4260 domain-containing protein [Pedobacter sp. SYP-B3415]
MKRIIALEEAGMFLACMLLFSRLEYNWWLFPACLLLPDLSMVAYAFGPRSGAWIYNLFHHKLVAIFLGCLGWYTDIGLLKFAGILLFAHSSMDRMLGYGLKYNDSFLNTHLGLIGQKK